MDSTCETHGYQHFTGPKKMAPFKSKAQAPISGLVEREIP